jgi:hypothetical protein
MAAVAGHAGLLRAMHCKLMVYGEVAMMAPGSPFDLPMSHIDEQVCGAGKALLALI